MEAEQKVFTCVQMPQRTVLFFVAVERERPKRPLEIIKKVNSLFMLAAAETFCLSSF